MNDVLVWIDVETSGLDPRRDALLEIACLVTDTDLNLLDENGYHAVIAHSPERVQRIKEETVPFVVQMHTTSGLWDRLPQGTALSVVQDELLAYIKSFAPQARQGRLAGNSVSLDKDFITTYLPAVSDHLHYRVVDVSSVVALATWWKNVPVFTKELRHEAMSDIRESIAELRYLRQKCF